MRISRKSPCPSLAAYAADSCKRSSEEAVEEYTKLFGDIRGMDISISPSGTMDMSSIMSGNSKDVTLRGDDLAALEEAADLVEETISQIPGVIQIENQFDQSEVKGKIVVDSQKAPALGTSESSVAGQINYVLNGMTAGQHRLRRHRI